MSLITRCPACETLFRIVPDQLRISEGWVRCGQCDEVFDGSIQLVKDLPSTLPPVPETLTVQEPPDTQAVQPAQEAQEAKEAQEAQDSESIEAPTPNSFEEQTQTVASQFLELDLDFTDLKTDSAEGSKPPVDFDVQDDLLNAAREQTDLPDSDVVHLSVNVPPPEEKLEIDSVAMLPNTKASSPADVSFLRPQSVEPIRSRPLVQISLSLLVFVLLVALAGQIIFHERDRLVAHEPRLTPWLLSFCMPFGCSLAPVQGIESVSIESSSFARVRGETYMLRFTLKNTALTPLAMPAVELTLTDALDQAVLRRVLMPTEFSFSPGNLDPGLSAPLEANFLVKLESTSQRMAGYRLLAFYP